ncbi:cytochrome P450 [Halenospora varia]|nr:cytochrome P450 [Halenospora varia]
MILPKSICYDYTHPIQLALGFVLLLGIAQFLYRLFFHPLSKVPGPFWARVTELWRTSRYFNSTWHEDVLEIHRKYGLVVRLSPNEVSVVSPELIKAVYSHQKGTRKTDWYNVWMALGGPKAKRASFFGTTNPKEHGFLRKRVSGIYSMTSIISLEPKVQTVLDTLWERFDAFAENREPINLSHWASYFTYDVVGTLCLGESMRFIQEGRDQRRFIENIHGSFYWIANIGYLLGQQKLITNRGMELLCRLSGLRITDYTKAFLQLSIGKVISRVKTRKPGDPHQDMLDHFLDMKGENGEPATMPEILTEVGNLLAAGADTTSVAIKAVVAPLLRDSSRYKRLQAELDEAAKACGSDSQPGATLAYSAVKNLPYLKACVKEGSRIHPSIVYQLPREVPSQGLDLEGFYISPSATISMSPLAQNRCKAIFGEDADEWKPERWLSDGNNSEENIRMMDKNLATFGYGSRTCVGKNLATFEATKFVAQLLLRYNVELAHPDRSSPVRSMWFAEIDDLVIRLSKRT